MSLPLEAGSFHKLTATNPAAGADWSISVPDNRIWRPLLIAFTIVTDATATNRYPGILITDSFSPDYNIVAETAIQASKTLKVKGLPGLATPSYITTDFYIWPLPFPVWIRGGATITSDIQQLQAGDQLSTIIVHCQSWPSQTDEVT